MLHWVVHLEDGPSPERLSHAAVAVGVELLTFEALCFNRDVYCGCPQPFDVHVFNTVSLRWRKLPRCGSPSPRGERHLESPCAVLVEDTVYVWRGRPRGNALYAFDPDPRKRKSASPGESQWSEHRLSGSGPEAVEGYSTCAWRRLLYVHGGWDPLTGHTNATYRLDTAAMAWTVVVGGGGARGGGLPPPASSHHSATVIGSKMYVFGGLGGYRGHRVYNYVRVFDAESERWLSGGAAGQQSPCPSPSPSPSLSPSPSPGGSRPPSRGSSSPSPLLLLPEGRWGHSAFAYGGRLYVFGGRNSYASPRFNDLWRFDPETGRWRPQSPRGVKGPPRWIEEMCCRMVPGTSGNDGDECDEPPEPSVAVLFGGKTLVLPPNPLCERYSVDDLYLLDLDPGLKTLCKLAVARHGLRRTALPHNLRWELDAMTAGNKTSLTQEEEVAEEVEKEAWSKGAAKVIGEKEEVVVKEAGLHQRRRQQQRQAAGSSDSAHSAHASVSLLSTTDALSFMAAVVCTLLCTVLRVPCCRETRQRMYY